MQPMTRENQTTTEPDTLPPASLREKALLLWVGALVLILDQFTKFIVEHMMPLNTMWEPFPEYGHLFRFTHIANTGTAFGLFPGGSLFFGVMAVLVGGAIVIYNLFLPGEQRLLRLALGLQLGGAIGNLLDRIRLGHVTDFLDFSAWPVFNLADTAIVGGVVVLGWMIIQETLAERRQAQAQQEKQGSLINDRATD